MQPNPAVACGLPSSKPRWRTFLCSLRIFLVLLSTSSALLLYLPSRAMAASSISAICCALAASSRRLG